MEQETADPGHSTVQLIFDERDVKPSYVNFYRFHTVCDEMIVDLGFHMPNPNPNPAHGQQQQWLVKLNDRIIMNYFTAKRLAQSLTQLVKRYEQQFGELLPPSQRQAPR
jgi:hypothetical protein